MALAPFAPREGNGLVERNTDFCVSAPDRMAAAQKMIGLDDERERRRQSHRTAYLNPRTVRGNIANHAVDAASAAEGQRSLFENAVSGCCPSFDHCRDPSAGCSLKLAARNYG